MSCSRKNFSVDTIESAAECLELSAVDDVADVMRKYIFIMRYIGKVIGELLLHEHAEKLS